LKILILNLIPNTVGDTLFLTPLFRVLKGKGHEVHVTVSPLNKMLLENNSDVDNLIVVDELVDLSKEIGRIKKLSIYFRMVLNLIKRCRKEKYDACMVPQPNFFVSQAIPYAIGAKQRIGYSYRGASFSFLLTDKVKFEEDSTEKSKRHYVDSVLDLAKPIGVKPAKNDRVVSMSIDSEAERRLLAEFKSCKFTKYVCFQPGAKWLRKQWPKEHFKELGKRLIKKNIKIVVLGSEKEAGLGESIKENSPDVLNLCGKITIAEVACVMKNAKLNVCNDSGLAHISSAVGTKTAVIYGATNPTHSMPLGKGKVIKITDGKAPDHIMAEEESAEALRIMKGITPDIVYKKTLKELR
jgi:heptosyltransferase II